MVRKLLLNIFLVLGALLTAQESRIIVSEDTVDHQSSNYDHLFSLMSQEKTKIKTMIKFNAVDWGQLDPSFSIESFVTGNLSVEPGVRILNFGVKNETGLKYLIEPSFLAKYYYNFARRERLGRVTNGFSGNYFFTGIVVPFGDNFEWYNQHLESNYFLYSGESEAEISTFYSATLQVGYGIQRRLANIGYIDVRGGYIRSIKSNYPFSTKGTVYVKVDIGFGLSIKAFRDLIE